ncbi:MAG TPA: AMP-binding protein [Burkholderiales bacterium]|nr:AMP-binding protein [Burkholderiales bacterium]
MSDIPLIGHSDPAQPVAYRGARPIPAGDFVADVVGLAERLPARSHLVNFCNDRYNFAVGFGAALLRDQITLLPPNRTPSMLAQLQEEHGGLYALVDDASEPASIERVTIGAENPRRRVEGGVPAFPEGRIAAIAFTSGSTGHPTPHRKSWGALCRGAVSEAQRFALEPGTPVTLVSTVPPQHMYGLESSLLMALRNGLAFHASRPFYPLDVRTALADVKERRVLVTTPFHLRAMLADSFELPPLHLIVCATAVLSSELAAEAEALHHAPLHEVYGFTEAGMVATRRTTEGSIWHALAGVVLGRDGDSIRVRGGHVETEVPFTDVVDLLDATHFELRGRDSDLVNIAGKRTSLAYLNHQLNGIDGVQDGVFFMPEESGNVTRLVAFVVAPDLPREKLVEQLRSRVDDVFMPRPLHVVDALPRNSTGKLPREALEEFARALALRSKREKAV